MTNFIDKTALKPQISQDSHVLQQKQKQHYQTIHFSKRAIDNRWTLVSFCKIIKKSSDMANTMVLALSVRKHKSRRAIFFLSKRYLPMPTIKCYGFLSHQGDVFPRLGRIRLMGFRIRMDKHLRPVPINSPLTSAFELSTK